MPNPAAPLASLASSTSPDAPTAPLLLGLAGLPQQQVLREECGPDPGIVCRLTYRLGGSPDLAGALETFLGSPVKIIFVLLLALVARWLAHRAINRLTIHASEASTPQWLRNRAYVSFGESPLLVSERRRQRAETTGSVLRSVSTFTIFTVAIVMALGELGLNLGPILASAGIVGVALGFGAQTLVRDFLSGIFMLVEDQFGVGDVINLAALGAGESVGTVEAVTLRITRIRDVDGTVWYLRNGEVVRVGNMSQGWARAVIDVSVAFEEEVPRIRDLMKQTADQIWQDPAWHGLIIEEPQVWGVEAMSKDQVVVRLVAKTAPLKQWEVARELRERIKATFHRESVDMAAAPA